MGDVASLKLQLTNSGDKDIAVETGRPAYDFVVTDADGLEVWRAVPESVDVADRQVVDAGETLAFSHDWSLVDMNGSPVPPGVYFVQGLINGHPDMETPTQEIEVAAG